MTDRCEATPKSPANAPTRAAPPGTCSRIFARIWLFGALSTLGAERPMMVQLRPDATAGDVIEAIGQRFGRRFLDQVLSEPGALFRCCRIFADGRPIHAFDEPLLPDGPAVEIEILLLMGYEGG
jgi:hypothetical protein